VTGLDLDPVMIDRARANAERAWPGTAGSPAFIVGDVASLPFGDGSFDLVVSTLSMHHWVEPTKVWPRSAASCGPAVVRSSGTSDPADSRSTGACPMRWRTFRARGLAW